MWANAFTTRQKNADINPTLPQTPDNSEFPFHVVSKNPRELATELCIASEEDPETNQFYKNNGLKTCKEIPVTRSLGKKPSRRSRKPGKRNPEKQNVKNKNKSKKQKGRKVKKDKEEDDDDRISGS